RVFHQGQPGTHFNIGGDNEISNLALAKMICQQLDHLRPSINGNSYESLIQFVTDRAGHDYRYAVSIDKINKELNWTPEKNFSQGLCETLSYYLSKYDCAKFETTLSRIAD